MDLCGRCYASGAHAHHEFIEFVRLGSEPKFHPAQNDPSLAKITHLPSSPPHPSPQSVQHMGVPVNAATMNHLAPPLTTATKPLPQRPPPHQRYSVPNLQQQPQQQSPVTHRPHHHQYSHSMPNIRPTRVCCDLCRQEGSRFSHYKCATCDDFDLCEPCHGTGFHGHHAFYQYQHGDVDGGHSANDCILEPQSFVLHPPTKGEQAVVHKNFSCQTCGVQAIKGLRYECTICARYDLCHRCYNGTSDNHGHHAFLRHSKLNDSSPIFLPAKNGSNASACSNGNDVSEITVEERDKIDLAVHANVMCDACHKHGIVGSRYECSVCQSFDLCHQCWESGTHGHHAFLKYTTPGGRPTLQSAICPPALSTAATVSSQPVHRQVECDNCGVPHIQGARYNCQVCECFDLCQRCYVTRVHGQHGFLRYDRPGAHPLFLQAQSPISQGEEEETCADVFANALGKPPKSETWVEQFANGFVGNSEGPQQGESFVDQFANELMENAVEDMAGQFGEMLGGVFRGIPTQEEEEGEEEEEEEEEEEDDGFDC